MAPPGLLALPMAGKLPEDIRLGSAAEPLLRRLFSGGSSLVATLASVAAHAAVVAVFLFQEPAAVTIGEVIIVDLVFTEEAAQTTHPPASEPAAPAAKAADELGADAEGAWPAPPVPEETSVAPPEPILPVTAVPEPALKSSEPMVEDIPRMRTGTYALPPRSPELIRSAPPDPPETVQAAEEPIHETLPIESANDHLNNTDLAKAGMAKEKAPQAQPSEEPAPTPESGAGTQTARDGLTEQAAVYSGRIKAAPLEGNPRPAYPARAIRRGWQGRIVLNVEILPTGGVGEIEIETSSGHGVLDRAAVKTVRQWRFTPATRAGSPVRTRAQVPVWFKLTR